MSSSFNEGNQPKDRFPKGNPSKDASYRGPSSNDVSAEDARALGDSDVESSSEALFENAYLRYYYEKVTKGECDGDGRIFADGQLSLDRENIYLRDNIDMEELNQKPIFELFDPPFEPIDVRTATGEEVEASLRTLVQCLTAINQHVVFAAHLSDRRLYDLLVNGVQTKEVRQAGVQYWYCCFHTETEELKEEDLTVWLTYYANAYQRELWQIRHPNEFLPYPQVPPYERDYLPADPDPSLTLTE